MKTISKSTAGFKYGQTLNAKQAAAIAAAWSKTLKKAGAAMRAAVDHFKINPTTAGGYPGPSYKVAAKYSGDLMAFLRGQVSEAMAKNGSYYSKAAGVNLYYQDYTSTEEAAAALASALKAYKKAAERLRIDRRDILANVSDDLREGLRLGANWDNAGAVYGDYSAIKIVEDVARDGYSRSCKWAKVTRRALVTIRRGYSLHLVGGLYTFIRGRRINRAGMKCEWCEQGRAFADVVMVRGYLVRGEHIKAASLAAAKRISEQHRAVRMKALLQERADAAAEKAQLDAVRVFFEDSIAGGNCQPGTKAFVVRVADLLGYAPATLTGREVLEYGRRFGVELYARRAINAAIKRHVGK